MFALSSQLLVCSSSALVTRQAVSFLSRCERYVPALDVQKRPLRGKSPDAIEKSGRLGALQFNILGLVDDKFRYDWSPRVKEDEYGISPAGRY